MKSEIRNGTQVVFRDGDGDHHGKVVDFDSLDGTYFVKFLDGDTGWFTNDEAGIQVAEGNK